MFVNLQISILNLHMVKNYSKFTQKMIFAILEQFCGKSQCLSFKKDFEPSQAISDEKTICILKILKHYYSSECVEHQNHLNIYLKASWIWACSEITVLEDTQTFSKNVNYFIFYCSIFLLSS